MKPIYTHDCSSCIYLGTITFTGSSYPGTYDLYFHPNEENEFWRTVIARWGSDGPDYYSSIESARLGHNVPLVAAYAIALSKGLLEK